VRVEKTHERLTLRVVVHRLTHMEVHFKPERESRLNKLAPKTGRATDELVEAALAGYLDEVPGVRSMLDGRYHEVKQGA
jgi:predicted DNA-binding protein